MAVSKMKAQAPAATEQQEIEVLEQQEAVDQAVINARLIEALSAITASTVNSAIEYLDLKSKIEALGAKIDALLVRNVTPKEAVAQALHWRTQLAAAASEWNKAHPGKTSPVLNVFPYNGQPPARTDANGVQMYASGKAGETFVPDQWVVCMTGRTEGWLRTTEQLHAYAEKLKTEAAAAKQPAEPPFDATPAPPLAPTNQVDYDLGF